MRRTVVCLLALLLAMSFAFVVSAEEVETTAEATAGFVGTVSATEPVDETQGQEEVASGEIVINQFAEEESHSEEIEIEQFAEEETGFWAWLKNAWQAILKFFGL